MAIRMTKAATIDKARHTGGFTPTGRVVIWPEGANPIRGTIEVQRDKDTIPVQHQREETIASLRRSGMRFEAQYVTTIWINDNDMK